MNKERLEKIYNNEGTREDILCASIEYLGADIKENGYADIVALMARKFKEHFKTVTLELADHPYNHIMLLSHDNLNTVDLSLVKLLHDEPDDKESLNNYSYEVAVGEYEGYNEYDYTLKDVSLFSEDFRIVLALLYHLIKIGPEDKERIEVNVEGHFMLEIDNRSGDLEYSITPDGAMKRLIKNDASIEK